ncbi:MAG: hypothetical protein SangKO_053150 [Sandaracinaceae bacterium]
MSGSAANAARERQRSSTTDALREVVDALRMLTRLVGSVDAARRDLTGRLGIRAKRRQTPAADDGDGADHSANQASTRAILEEIHAAPRTTVRTTPPSEPDTDVVTLPEARDSNSELDAGPTHDTR